jgi:hypothetical protein
MEKLLKVTDAAARRSEAMRAFAQALFERLGSGLTRGQAYSAAGYTKNPDAAKANASRLLKSAKHIVDRVQ